MKYAGEEHNRRYAIFCRRGTHAPKFSQRHSGKIKPKLIKMVKAGLGPGRGRGPCWPKRVLKCFRVKSNVKCFRVESK